MNVWDILILLAVVGALFLALRGMRRTRGEGKGCGSGCGCCGADCAARQEKKQ